MAFLFDIKGQLNTMHLVDSKPFGHYLKQLLILFSRLKIHLIKIVAR